MIEWQKQVIRRLFGEDSGAVIEWIERYGAREMTMHHNSLGEFREHGHRDPGMPIDGERANAGVNFTDGFAETKAEDEWYDSVGLGLAILGLHWYSDVTPEQDAFVLAFADEISERPEHERD
jgi:hypothetical protein